MEGSDKGNMDALSKRQAVEAEIQRLEFEIQHLNTMRQDATDAKNKLNLAKLALSNLSSG